jgi:hypothetical protein
MSADRLDSALELAKGCPVIEIAGAVDVYEAGSGEEWNRI